MKLTKRKRVSYILILCPIIILFLICLSSIISSNYTYKYSYEQSNWIKNYYSIDGYAQYVLSKIDNALFNAEQQAVNYIMTNEYLENKPTTIPLPIHNINKIIYNNDINNTYDVLNNTYKYLAVQYLKPIEQKYGGDVITIYNQDNSIYSLYYKNTFELPKDTLYKLDVQANINDILYDIFIDNNTVSGSKIDFKSRYDIINWSQLYEK